MTEKPRKRKPGAGRKRVYPPGNDGAPQLNLRLPPDLLEWIRTRGGQDFVRQLLADARAREEGS